MIHMESRIVEVFPIHPLPYSIIDSIILLWSTLLNFAMQLEVGWGGVEVIVKSFRRVWG